MKLEANQSGSWRKVANFPADRRDAVISAVVPLARVLGRDVRWSIVDDAGKREWLGTLAEAKVEAVKSSEEVKP